MERVNCDLCGSNDPRPLFDRIDRFTDNDFKFVKCAQCGLIYLNPRPTQSEIVEFYPDNYESYKLLDYDNSSIQNWHIQRMLQTLLDFVEKFVNVRGHLLDIGCATGRFLITARDRGWEVKGVELVEKAAQIARQEYLLDVTIGSFESVSLPENYYGVITLWDVLEHTQSPSLTLKKIFSILKPSGWLIMNIPNAHSIDRRLFGPHWMGFDPPRHLFVIPKDTLRDMLHKAGFEPRYWKSFLPSYFSFAMSLERWLALRSPTPAKFVGRISTFPGLRFIFEPYFALANRLLLSGLITVFAQKPPLEKRHETT